MRSVAAFFRSLFAWLILLPLLMIACVLFMAVGALAVLLLPLFIWFIRRQIRKLRDEPVIIEPFIPDSVFDTLREEIEARNQPATAAPQPAEPYDYQAYYAWYYQQYGHYPEQAAHDTPEAPQPQEEPGYAAESTPKSAG